VLQKKIMASSENEPCHSPSASDQTRPPPPSNVCIQKFRLYETRSVMLSYSPSTVLQLLSNFAVYIGIYLILSRDFAWSVF